MYGISTWIKIYLNMEISNLFLKEMERSNFLVKKIS